jgi:transcription antitermination factor NusG
VVSFGGQPVSVDEDVIQIVKDRVDQSGFVRLGEELKQGDRVVIKAGPLREFEGIFERKLKDNERITVLLTTISYQGRLVINKDLIEKVNAHHA